MKNLFGLLIIIAVSVLSSCDKKDPYYLSEEEVAAFENIANPGAKDIVFIYKEDLYFLSNINAAPRRLTNTPKIRKMSPRISPDHTKVAFLDSLFNTVIIKIATGDTLKKYSFLQFPADRNFDWNPNENPALSDGLYSLVGDSVYFTETVLEKPDITFAGNLWHSAAYDKFGNFFFLITEESDVDLIPKLYRWEKATKKIKRMTLERELTNPTTSSLTVATNGDLLLKTSFSLVGGVDTYYIYPAGSLKHTIKHSQFGMLDVWYNGDSKQAVIYGNNPVKLITEMSVKNHQGYARSVDKSIDTSFVKNFIQYFNWK